MTALHIESSSSTRFMKRVFKTTPCTDSFFDVYARYKHALSSRPQGKSPSIFSLLKNNLASHIWSIKQSLENPSETTNLRTQRVYEAQASHFQMSMPKPFEVYLECLEDSSLHVDSISTEQTYDAFSKLSDTETTSNVSTYSECLNVPFSSQRPELPPPSMFMMVFMANKMVTSMNQQKLRNYKFHMERLEEKREKLREEKIAQWKKQSDATRAAAPWSTGMAVFSWITCCLEVLAGIGMIAMGNVVGGSLLLAGGVIQLTSHIMMQTGGWDKVAELLPGDNPEEKKKLVSWMQIGVAVFSMVLAGAGGAVVGTSGLSPAMQTASSLATSGLLVGQGIVTIGNGISQSRIKDVHAELQRLNTAIQRMEYKQQTIREKVEGGMKFDVKCINLLAQALRQRSHFYSNVFKLN